MFGTMNTFTIIIFVRYMYQNVQIFVTLLKAADLSHYFPK